jgi:hypothetical protein
MVFCWCETLSLAVGKEVAGELKVSDNRCLLLPGEICQVTDMVSFI